MSKLLGSSPMRSYATSKRFVLSRAKALVQNPVFVVLTVGGNAFVVLAASLFYFLERGINPKLEGFIDALWWAIQTVTTVGYGDISPITVPGKIAGMGLMLFGTALFSAFTALFAATLLAPEITEVEEEVRSLERSLKKET